MTKSLFPLALLALTLPLHAGIDSGGGKATIGAMVNHGSLGEPLAPVSSVAQNARNYPGLIEVLYAARIATDDLDNDGMPDSWERINNLQDPNLDADQDGQSNIREFAAGTNPNSGSSVFRMGTAALVNGNWEFDLPTMNGRQYKIWSSPDLKPGSWHLHSTVSGTGESFQIVVPTGGAPALFFRVEVILP